MLFLAARQRGHDAHLFRKASEVDAEGGFLFYRMEQQNMGDQRPDNLCLLDRPGIIGIVKREAVLEYENKVYQCKKFPTFVPQSILVNKEINAEKVARVLGFPFVSKSRSGSGSAAVRIIPDMLTALQEAEIVFNRGLHVAREVQEGYLLWQKFLTGNDYSYRVVRIGSYYWMLRVFNRKHTPLASGSGSYEPVIPRSNEEFDVLDKAVKFFDAADTRWCGIDLLRDPSDGDWRVLETTLAWDMQKRGSNADCQVFDKDGVLTEPAWIGAHQFEILLNELERGVFDG